jgi:hypothetical protein
MKKPEAQTNNQKRAGCRASDFVLFGPFSRYCVCAVHTRFDVVQWIVTDAEKPDDWGLPSIIRQNDDFNVAVSL